MGKQLSGPRDLRLISMYLAYDCGEAYMESPLLRTSPAQRLQHRDRMPFHCCHRDSTKRSLAPG